MKQFSVIAISLLILLFSSAVFSQTEREGLEISVGKTLEKGRFDWYHGVSVNQLVVDKYLFGLSFALGIQTSYFQRSFNPRAGALVGYKLLNPTDKIVLYGIGKLGYTSYLLKKEQRINQYESVLGYQFFYGKKIKFFQGAYAGFGYEYHSFSTKKWDYFSYAFDIGIFYEF